MYDARSPRRLSAPGAFHALQHRATPNLSFFLGDIRPRSRQLAPPGKLRCVLTPSASLRARVPQFFGAVKGAPERHVRVAKPYDSTSALRHGANNRPKEHCGPSACKENSCVETTHGASFIFDFFPSQAIKVRLKRLVASFWYDFQTLPEHQNQTKKARAIV